MISIVLNFNSFPNFIQKSTIFYLNRFPQAISLKNCRQIVVKRRTKVQVFSLKRINLCNIFMVPYPNQD